MTTRADVAKLAGVSESTVSYALNGKRPITPETKKKILAAVKKLNYSPHFAAGVLAGGKANSIALIFPNYSSKFAALQFEYVEGVIDGAKARNYHVIAWPGEDTPTPEIMKVYKSGLVSGVILMEILNEDPRVDALIKAEIPFVMIGRNKNHQKLKYVDRDFETVVTKGLKHLESLGHRKIAVLTQQRKVAGQVVAVDDRFTNAIKIAGKALKCDLTFLNSENSFDGGAECFARLKPQIGKITAVVGMADLQTVGFMSAAQKSGVRIPQDLSIVGVNNPRNQVNMVHPTLTVIDLPAHEIGEAAAHILIDQINGEERFAPQQLLSGELILNESTEQRTR